MPRVPITVAHGDGIGPEIMDATLRILEAAGALLDIETIEIGERIYLSGQPTGMNPGAFESIRRTKVFLKAPITTPQGGGYKSLNVTIRGAFGLFANVRPCVAYHPFVDTKHPGMNVVIVRENEEDLYAGIEHRQTDDVYQSIKIITRPGTEKIIRYAFEYAVKNGRKKVTCFTKDNIMKLTDGLFHRIFEEIGEEYPQIAKEHYIIDIGTARLADRPLAFDVIVTPNLYGDIISDVAAEITGSVGLGGSANIGQHAAMFEAIHGSAPDIAGKGIANPSGLLLGAVMMLVHIGQPEVAERVHNAWLRVLEEGIHTGDIYTEGVSHERVGTKEFADAVIARLGQMPETLKPVEYDKENASCFSLPALTHAPAAEKKLVGSDIFLHWRDARPEAVAELGQRVCVPGLKLDMITNRGVVVWPEGEPDTFCTDHWRLRFMGEAVTHDLLLEQMKELGDAGQDVIKTENLYTFDGKPGFSKGRG